MTGNDRGQCGPGALLIDSSDVIACGASKIWLSFGNPASSGGQKETHKEDKP